jgi:GNAT superfamily N-acetyltransferase
METAIRRATVADARPIAEVHVASWRWAYRGDLPDSVLKMLSVDDREAAHRDQIAGGGSPTRVLVAVDAADAIVGFASTGPMRDDDASAGTGELYAIYVLQDLAGAGLGHALLARASEDLRATGFNRATLWVLASNARARRFYEREGWTWDGTTSEHRFDCGNRPIVRYAADLPA